jgi:transcriptional regulator with XRE-family HTH domain
MKFTSDLTDAAILQEFGARLERRRIDANLTQAQLAEEAGISKRTLERIEAGRSTDWVMLVRALRALKLIVGLESLVSDRPQSPITLLKQKGRERKRVRRALSKSDRATAAGSVPWKWGE